MYNPLGMKRQSYYLVIAFLTMVAIGYWVGSSYATKLTPTAKVEDHIAHHMNHSDHMTVTNERDFLEAMVPHHQEAIDTAIIVREKGEANEVVQTLARDIIETQTAEIAQMREWYEEWYGEPLPEAPYTPMMRNLTSLEGSALNRVFIEDMILHHQGAVEMVMSVSPYVVRDELRSFMVNILTTQTSDITLMKSWLSE